LAVLKLAILVSGVLALAKLGFLDFITGSFDTGRFGDLDFFTSSSNNLLKNIINCVSLFQITLYEEVWWHMSMCNKLNQSKFEGYFFPNRNR
jgi:hypothetical protein